MTDESRDRRRDAGGDAAAGRRPDAAGGAPAGRRPSKPAPGWVFGGALGAFFAALALLAFQVRAGQDPALGPAQPVARQVDSKPRRILVRKVIKRVVVHHPAVVSAAPAPAEPAATSAPAAAPAPAPAPLTTQSS